MHPDLYLISTIMDFPTLGEIQASSTSLKSRQDGLLIKRGSLCSRKVGLPQHS